MAYSSKLLKPDDLVRLRKPHPCGGKDFRIISCGADFHLRCEKCGSPVKLTRVKLEKMISRSLSS